MSTGMAKKSFGHRRRGIGMWVKIRLRAIGKSTFGIPLGVTPNLISARKTKIFRIP